MATDDGSYHVPVLLQEAVNALRVREDGVYVDCTFGGGGHSKLVLEQLGASGRLIAFDQDEAARKNAAADDRLIFVPHNFRYLKRFLRLHGFEKVDGVLADLGVSSHQFDESDRGFSIRFDAALDMRMDRRQTQTAAMVLNEYEEGRLHKIFERYGEVTNAKTLANRIVVTRKISPIKTMSDLKAAVADIVKGNPNRYFAQVFQALRIEVNEELNALREMLLQVPEVLRGGGRIAVITFHSLEDRIVKEFFRSGHFEESEDPTDLFGTERRKSLLSIITKKPITPSENELNRNPRSRSAKLRVAERIETD